VSGSFVVSQLGARMHYAVPRMLYRAGRLERLYTDICAVKGWPRALAHLPPAMLPAALRRLKGRVPRDIPPDRIVCFEGLGLASVLHRMVVPTRAGDTRAALEAGRSFSRNVIRHGFGKAAGFYGMSGECLEQLDAARKQGLRTAVEQIIAPRMVVDRLVSDEVARHPEWAESLGPDPWASEFAARERAEWDVADIIICPSAFVRDGVGAVGGPVERCVIVPYGVDAPAAVPGQRAPHSGPLRVLTVGAVGLRKGSPYVLEAARRLAGLAEFRMVGPAVLPRAIAEQLRRSLDLAGPTPRAEIARHYAWADVFFLPSVCEGSATVVYEALAAGLPVVTTPNAGSVVRDGVDGFICSAGDTDAMYARLETLARDSELRRAMGEEARKSAAAHDLDAYGRRLLAALDSEPVPAGEEPLAAA